MEVPRKARDTGISQLTALHEGDLTLYQHYVRENIDTINAIWSNEKLLDMAMAREDSGRVLCQLRANTSIDNIIYKHDFSKNQPEFVCNVCMGLLASGYPAGRMRRMVEGALVECALKKKDTEVTKTLATRLETLKSPLTLKAQCRIYMKRYFSARGPLCAHASRIQRGHRRDWHINYFKVLHELPLAEPIKNYLMLGDLIPDYT